MKTRIVLPLLLTLGVSLGLVACPGGNSYPGKLLGTVQFDAKLARTNCDPIDVPDAGTRFDAIFSRDAEGERAYVTVGTFARDAGFEGQTLSSYYAANVRFETCGDTCTGPELQETIAVTILSESQLAAVGGECPELLADGGVALDGGEPPDLSPDGFNGVRACGQLFDNVVPGDGCDCGACTATYRLDGKLQ